MMRPRTRQKLEHHSLLTEHSVVETFQDMINDNSNGEEFIRNVAIFQVLLFRTRSIIK